MSEEDIFRLLGLAYSSPSASDLSEGVSDMSLSTSPGSDGPQHLLNTRVVSNGHADHGTEGGSSGSGGGSESAPKPRRKTIARQLSSNPYLTSASSIEDHMSLTPASSFAFGENAPYEDPKIPMRASSFPVAGEVLENYSYQQHQLNQIRNLSHIEQPGELNQYYTNVVNGNNTLPRGINSWGHFSKSCHNRYKYRRSDYSSDSEEDALSPNPSQLPHKLSAGFSGQAPHTCLSDLQHVTTVINRKKSAMDIKKDHNHYSEGVRPSVFKERFAVSCLILY